ncbi:hypothetical protein QR46_0616 [Giardia duodenalis assemblage B]|uniref:Zinc finger PHD-type domain-containing protein n=1 Tax=Giardia duodenalis assemblage B TaxID=1394984 RepID=A0A132NZC5_GIAIN|nr:hypothetical protein QR46_0616 [Giardia intestinalis assemblage B]
MTSTICYLCAQPDGIVCAGECGRAYCPMCLVETHIQEGEPVFTKERIDMGKSLLSHLDSSSRFTCAACKEKTSVCSICFGRQVSDQDPFLVCHVSNCKTVFHRQCYKVMGFPSQDASASFFSCPRHTCLHCKQEKSDRPISICIRCNSMIHLQCRKAVNRTMRPLFFGSREADCPCLCNRCYILILSASPRPLKQSETALYLNMHTGRRRDVSLEALSTLLDTPFVDRLCHIYKLIQKNGHLKKKVVKVEESKIARPSTSPPKLDNETPKEPQLKQLNSEKLAIQSQNRQEPIPELDSAPVRHSMVEAVAAPLPVSVIVTTSKTSVSFTKAIQPEIVRCQTIMIRRKPEPHLNSSV